MQVFLRALDIDLSPATFKPYGPYALLAKVRVGDHVAVRSATDGPTAMVGGFEGGGAPLWHHGIYVGDGNLVHMPGIPGGNISKVPYEMFMGNIISEGSRIDAAGVVEYRDDSDAHRMRAAFLAELATQDAEMQALVYDGCCFATWCRSARCDMRTMQILKEVAATAPIHRTK